LLTSKGHRAMVSGTTALALAKRETTRGTSVIGAAPHQRTEARLAQRNGRRQRLLATTAGDLELRIPKLRAGSFFPSEGACSSTLRRCGRRPDALW
jgi:transposase-like protein